MKTLNYSITDKHSNWHTYTCKQDDNLRIFAYKSASGTWYEAEYFNMETRRSESLIAGWKLNDVKSMVQKIMGAK